MENLQLQQARQTESERERERHIDKRRKAVKLIPSSSKSPQNEVVIVIDYCLAASGASVWRFQVYGLLAGYAIRYRDPASQASRAERAIDRSIVVATTKDRYL